MLWVFSYICSSTVSLSLVDWKFVEIFLLFMTSRLIQKSSFLQQDLSEMHNSSEPYNTYLIKPSNFSCLSRFIDNYGAVKLSKLLRASLTTYMTLCELSLLRCPNEDEFPFSRYSTKVRWSLPKSFFFSVKLGDYRGTHLSSGKWRKMEKCCSAVQGLIAFLRVECKLSSLTRVCVVFRLLICRSEFI